MRRIVLTLFSVLLFSMVFGQKVSIQADTNTIALGGQTTVRWVLSYRVDEGDVSIQLPDISKAFDGAIEVLGISSVDTTVDKNDIASFSLSQQFKITSFEVGEQQLPELLFVFNDSTIKSYPLPLFVTDVDVTEQEELDPIKEIKEDPLTWRDWLATNSIYIGIALLVLAAAAGIVIYLRSRPKAVKKEAPEIVVLPHDWALTALQELQEKQLWQGGQYKEYHSALSEIVRGYIEKRYHFQALEQTSDEVLMGLRTFPITSELKEQLDQMLRLGDLVKFAKETPIAQENEMCLANAKLFIEQTSIKNTEQRDA